jgi:hypothetical protein
LRLGRAVPFRVLEVGFRLPSRPERHGGRSLQSHFCDRNSLRRFLPDLPAVDYNKSWAAKTLAL